MADIPVLVVGAGPVGLALALDLSWRGIPCTVIDQGDGSLLQPRMDLVSVRTMEFCRRWGIAEAIENAGYPRDVPQDIVYVTSVTGFEMGREVRPAMRDEQRPAFSPQKRERCPQNYFDPVLLQAVRSYSSATVHHHCRLIAFRQDVDRVLAEVEDTRSGSRQTIACQYLVGCDGAGSIVRRDLDIEMRGENLLTNSVNILLRHPDVIGLSGKRPLYRFVLIDDKGLWATMVAINGRDQWRLQVIEGPSSRGVGADYIDSVITRAFGRRITVSDVSAVHWQRRELVAERYVDGRVILCGDSAHQMSPTGGFGMNTGIGEAVDLGWKLAARLAGWGGPNLLASYDGERRPIAQRNVAEASNNLARMTAIRDLPGLLDEGPAAASLRSAVGQRVSEAMSREWNAINIHIGYRYDGSSICVSDETPFPADDVTRYVQTARPGARAPHVWLDDARSTLDLFGRDFVLLRLGSTPPATDLLEEAFSAASVPLTVQTLDLPSVRQAYDANLVLVRPDGHVGWRSNHVPAEPDHIVETLRGAAGAAVTRHTA